MSLRSQFFEFDDVLTSHGVRPLTQWWRDGIGEWLDAYEQGQVLELFACVGRGAAKSTVLYKLGLFFTLFGDFDVPPGERHYAVVLSRFKDEATKGILIISGWLRLLGVRHRPAGDVVDIDDMPRGIRVVTASVSATSGWRAYFVGKDERSKWPSGGVADVDAPEIDTSAAAMTATHPLAPVVAVGSAWGDFGSFYEAIASGTDATKVVLGPAPTWVAAPHVTEESTRKKEQDPRKWAREYACEFQASAVGAFDSLAVDACFVSRRLPPDVISAVPTFIIDASSGRADAWTWARCRWLLPTHSEYKVERRYSHFAGGWYLDFHTDSEGKLVPLKSHERFAPILRFDYVSGVEGSGFWRNVSAEKIVKQIAKECKESGAVRVVGDQREAYALTSLFAQQNITFTSIAWTSANKPEGVETVRRWMRDGQLWLPHERGSPTSDETRPHQKLRRELLEFEEKITPSGQLTFGARGNRHDDYVALLITAALAEQNGLLSMSPTAPRVTRHIPRGFVP
ncbi:hypothetical protein AKJ09_11226 [Labilithrix luteola]|uniref:Phage terminase, large subunit n=1 Tax=Labilithrix luteola TaxID=1391654 RepID=A0A0K1QFR3_9BACT|nr:hypothetical protein [Labilithrix luteola]AKV04563.1 hypothetical protein AKJ09_11226 [Labilithrix luteola]